MWAFGTVPTLSNGQAGPRPVCWGVVEDLWAPGNGQTGGRQPLNETLSSNLN